MSKRKVLIRQTLQGNPMSDKDIRKLVEGVVNYLEWEKTIKANGPHRPLIRDSFILIDFLRFATHKNMVWEDIFTLHTLKAFSHFSGFKNASRSLIELSGFLYSNGRIPGLLTIPRRPIDLPDPFEPYLQQQSHKVSPNHLRQSKGVLVLFHSNLAKTALHLPE